MLLPRELVPNTLLTQEVQRYIKGQPWPSGLEIRLLDRETFIRLILFRDNMLTFDGEDLQQIANVCNRIFEKLRADGIPIWLKVYQNKEQEEALRD